MTDKDAEREVSEAKTSIKEALGMIVGDDGCRTEDASGTAKDQGSDERDAAKASKRTPASK